MWKTEINQKTDKKIDLGMTFSEKILTLIDFWGPREVPREGLWKDFGRKILRLKRSKKKKLVKVIASAGTADPGKEGFREDSQVGKI